MAISKRTDSNLSIIARAGCGKTTTIVQLVYRLLGHTNKSLLLEGSEQQEEIWRLGCSGPTPSAIQLVSFGTRSVDDIKKKLKITDKRVAVKTVHSFGMSLLNQNRVCTGNYGKWVDGNKLVYILTDLLDFDSWQGLNSAKPGLIRFYKRMVGFIKSDLIPFQEYEDDMDFWEETFAKYCAMHGIEVKQEYSELLAEHIVTILNQCVSSAGRFIDFDDMIWLPHQLGLVSQSKPTVPLVLVDEAQDLNVGQRQILLAAGSRLIIVADERQAIYGFQGADVNSVTNFEEELSKRSLGLVRLPLNQSRRCPHTLVPFVKPLVPDFEVYPSNSKGNIYQSTYQSLASSPREYLGTDEKVLIVARRNAYNVSMAIKFITKEIACCILGKDFGDDLIETLTKIVDKDTSYSCEEAIPLIQKWRLSEVKRISSIYPDPTGPLTLVEDKADCLTELCSRNITGSVQLTIAFINELFTDKDSTRITFSSIHKAKGLEAPIIIFLHYNECPEPKVATSSPMYEQEKNLFYVAITRTLGTLYFVESPIDPKTKRIKPCPLTPVQEVINKLAKRFEPKGVSVATPSDTSCPFDVTEEDEDEYFKSGGEPKAKPKTKKKPRFTDDESVRANKSTDRALSSKSKPAILPISESRQLKIEELRKQLKALPPEDLEQLWVELKGLSYAD